MTCPAVDHTCTSTMHISVLQFDNCGERLRELSSTKGRSIMTIAEKKEIVNQIISLLIQLTVDDDHHEVVKEVPVSVAVEQPKPKKNEVSFLTIKECTKLIHGLSDHTMRLLIAQNKVTYFRAGAGERGKILVNKESLLSYFSGNEEV